ncbi:MAG: hypothetical protein ACREAD_03005 [Nitrosopumilaceae archaeon]
MPIQLRKGLFANLIEGDAEIMAGEEVTINGLVMGDLKIQPSAHVKINGMVSGNLYLGKESKVDVQGFINKCVYNSGGNLEVHGGRINGKIVQKD